MLKKALLLVLGLALVSTLLVSQQTNARIIGTVTDADGNPLPGVAVEATSAKLIGKASTVSNENGVYRLLNLAPGAYKLSYILDGFQTLVRDNVVLALEQTITVNVSMKLGKIEEAIVVKGAAPLIDVKSTARGMTLTKEVFQTLPKGRNFDSLITAIPGVSNEPLVAGTSVDGASGLENMYYIDGTDVTNIVSGARGQGAAFDFVDEVQVKTSGYQAEFGGSLGGVINVVTRSGGNEFHGEVLGFYSGAPLRSSYRDILMLKPDDTSEAIYQPYKVYYGVDNDHRFEGGLNLGGYVIKDKLWFFGTFLPVYYTNERDVTYYGTTTAKTWKTHTENWNWQAKLTSQPFKNLRLSASINNQYSKYKGDLDYAYGNSAPAVSYDEYGYSYPNLSVSGTADVTLGNNALLSIRGGYWTSNTKNPLVLPTGIYYRFRTEQSYISTTNIGLLDVPPEYQHPAGWRNMANYPTANVMNKNEKYGVNADLTYFLNLGGEHQWKLGGQWVRQGEDVDQGAVYPIVQIGWGRDCILYGTNYGSGKYGYYGVRGGGAAGPYGSVYTAYSNRYSFYVQDSWTIANRLTLNLGLRAEHEYIPSYSDNPDFKDLKPIDFPFSSKMAPRLGFVWDVKGDSSLKVFGSMGWFYDVMKLYMASGSYGGFKWKSAFYTLDDYRFDQIGVNGNFPGTLLKVYDFRVPSFDSTQPDLKPMGNREISFGVEQKLRDDLAFSARLVNKKLTWTIEDIGVLTEEGESYFTANPGGDFINEKWEEAKALGLIPAGAPDVPKAKRDYLGLNLALDKRFSNNWMGGISYTWSRLTGNYSGLASGDEYGRASPNVERYYDLWYLAYDKELNPIDGPLPSDRTHYFKVYGSYVFPFGLTTGVILNAMSGVPTSTEYTMDVQGYLPFNRNNLGRAPFLWFANLYLEYNFKIGKNNLNVNLNVDNLFDVKTAQRIYQIYNQTAIELTDDQRMGSWDIDDYEYEKDPRYRMKTAFYGPLTARLGFKFSF